ncbi:MAG: translational GTPase TypA [Planctomycetota bacterium]
MKPIRNIAIVAHVDHGKTTLVDGLFRTAGTFRANQTIPTCVMDSNAQEKERGITILAKNTAVDFHGTRINIVDTPGHADFGGQVERTLAMADAVLLLVDAYEGPMPQTRFVLRKAFERGLKALVMINKVDRPGQRAAQVLDEVFDLFVELGANDSQLEFPVIYGSGRDGWAAKDWQAPDARERGLVPLLEMILAEVPQPPQDDQAPLQFQAATLDHGDFLGRIGIGRVARGTLVAGSRVALCHPARTTQPTVLVKSLFRFEGLERKAVEKVTAGDIAVVAGIEELSIGDTLCPLEQKDPLPAIKVDEPTISMVFQVNDSPFSGLEGEYVTSRHVRARLERAALRDVALQLADTGSAESIEVKGRGVMHLGVLVEEMRREGYEFAVGKPTVITRVVDGVRLEPYELASVETPQDAAGRVIEYMGRRRGEMLSMEPLGETQVKLEFRVPARGLIGARTALLTLSQGNAILAHVFDSWRPEAGKIARRAGGVLVADRSGPVVPYALNGLQDRGIFFLAPGVEVYEGMVVGANNKEGDLALNVCRTKKLTNMRAAGKDDNVILAPPRNFSLEEYLEYLEEDELLEVTPKNLRLRKRILNADQRKKFDRRDDE